MLDVYKNGIKVGVGFSILHNNQMHEPIISTEQGEALPSDWFMLRPLEHKLAILSDTIQ
jgi:hypothetical protein